MANERGTVLSVRVEPGSVSDSDASVAVQACDTCGGVAVADGDVVCCGEQMAAAGDAPADADPTLGTVLRTVFDMSETELDVCLCVMEAGEVTASDLAEETGFDRSIVTRHLNHLAELGVIDKNRRLLERGGHVYVYTPTDESTVRDRLQGEFLEWVRVASTRLAALDREKVESLAGTDGAEPRWRIYHEG